MEETLPRMYMELMPAKYYKKIVIKDGETGLLYFDNQFERQLETGTYFSGITEGKLPAKYLT